MLHLSCANHCHTGTHGIGDFLAFVTGVTRVEQTMVKVEHGVGRIGTRGNCLPNEPIRDPVNDLHFAQGVVADVDISCAGIHRDPGRFAGDGDGSDHGVGCTVDDRDRAAVAAGVAGEIAGVHQVADRIDGDEFRRALRILALARSKRRASA